MSSVYAFALNQVKGLPVVGLKASDRKMRNVANKRLGATTSILAGKATPALSDVMGQPSMKLQRAAKGVVTTLRRRSQWADFITDEELKALEKLAQQILTEAKSLSKGSLSARELARRGHPYGRGAFAPGGMRRRGLGRLQGARSGISNMAVINQQSGEFLASWNVNVQRDKGGVTLELANEAPQSVYLAFGSAHMKAHGAFTTAMAKSLPQINREWARLTHIGKMRAAQLEKQLEVL